MTSCSGEVAKVTDSVRLLSRRKLCGRCTCHWTLCDSLQVFVHVVTWTVCHIYAPLNRTLGSVCKCHAIGCEVRSIMHEWWNCTAQPNYSVRHIQSSRVDVLYTVQWCETDASTWHCAIAPWLNEGLACFSFKRHTNVQFITVYCL